MRTFLSTALIAVFAVVTAAYAGYEVGDKARDFSLKNVDGKMVSLKDYPDAKGFIVVFTCNHCPYSKFYEDRLIALHKEFAPKGYPVIAINPNSAEKVPEDSYDNMVKRAKEKGFPFVYLHDETQEIAKAYGASRTPHVYMLQKSGTELNVAYIGAIDDSPKDAESVEARYVSDAIEALMNRQEPDPDFTKAIGCTIKWQ